MVRNIYIIAKAVWIELIRRKDVYLILVLSFMFVIGVLVSRIIGIESADTANFLMSFGLTLSYYLAIILAAITAARQIPRELEKRTIQPVLAKPISRAHFLLGKILAVASFSSGILVVLLLISYLPTPKSSDQQLLLFSQLFLLQILAIGIITVLATGLSLFMPALLSSLISLVIFFAGSFATKIAAGALPESGNLVTGISTILLSMIPDFALFNHIDRFVQGGAAIDLISYSAALGYGLLLSSGMFIVSAFKFERTRL